MAELSCNLSPLVFAELYRRLASTSALEESLTFRLQDIHYDMAWLEEAADAYQAKWEYDLQYVDAGNVDDFAVQQPDHALLATWILAGLRNTGPCYDLSSGVAASVLEKATAVIPGLSAPLPASLSPIIYGWTLGRLIGQDDLPAVPAVLPEDDNVQAAFVGLVEHVLLLQGLPEPWPEMMCMAAYWRGYGLAEGMRPEEGNGGSALNRLRDEAQPSMEQPEFARLHRHFQPFVSRRHSVSHVATDSSRPSFTEVVETIRDWPDLRATIHGLTQFVFQEVARTLPDDPPPKALRSDPWARLMTELQTEW